MKRRERLLFYIFCIGVTAISIGGLSWIHNTEEERMSFHKQRTNHGEASAQDIQQDQNLSNDVPEETQETREIAEARKQEPLPSFVDVEIAFTSQAPFGNWGQPYQDACEEASVIIAVAAVGGEELTPSQVDKEIQRLVEVQNELFGDYIDTTAEETKQILRDVYDIQNAFLENDITVNTLRTHLSRNAILIAPMAGRELGNPHFTAPGPVYHMLVIKGYDDHAQEFITHDVGTKHGANYRYPYNTIINAIHDWSGSDSTIRNGPKRVIVVPL